MVDYNSEYKIWVRASNEFNVKCKHLENYELIKDMLDKAVDFLRIRAFKDEK